ncbi:MAG: hypothetical protein VB954_16335 [Thalassolituus sp.]|uniref:hypothetical protein n=1 Tax=Thalassolituus sp. TaxID=2030822 RepID=UPI00398298AD
MSNQKLEFLYQSIADTQATIRAIDVKIGFLFIVAFIPLAGLEKIISTFQILRDVSIIYLIVMLLTSFIWIVSIYALFKSLSSISNPAKHIEGNIPAGMFYSGSIYSFKKIDNFFNFPIMSNDTIEDFKRKLPNDENAIVEELIFEKMKLSYIRDVKIMRSSLSIRFSFYWIILGSLLWLFSILKVGY